MMKWQYLAEAVHTITFLKDHGIVVNRIILPFGTTLFFCLFRNSSNDYQDDIIFEVVSVYHVQ